MAEWQEVKLHEIAKIRSGKRPPVVVEKQSQSFPIPVIGGSGTMGFTKEALFDHPILVTGRVGTLGRLHYIKKPSWPSDNTLVITPVDDTNLNCTFFYYTLLPIVSFAVQLNRGSSNPLVTQRDLGQMSILIPPLPEQKAIAHILGTLDDKIELNRRMNETLEEMAKAIFKSWFVDFDPVIDNALKAGNPIPDALAKRAARRRAILEKQEREDPNLPKLPPEIARLFPDSFEDSPLGPIPKGWRVEKIGKLVRCVGGSTPSTKEPKYWENGTYPFVTPKDMASLTGPVILDAERHITQAGVEKISSRLLPVGTVLLSSRAPIGYLAITEVLVSINQGIIAMICDGELPSLFVFRWIEANMDIIKANAGGTTFSEISKRNFRSLPVVVPAGDILSAFVQEVELLHQRIVSNVREIEVLAATRDLLLPKLISGELRIPDAEKLVEGDL